MEQASNDVTQVVTDVNIRCDDCYYDPLACLLEEVIRCHH